MQAEKGVIDVPQTAENIDPAISNLTHSLIAQTQLAPVAPMAPVESNLNFQREGGHSTDLSRHPDADNPSRCISTDPAELPKRNGKRELSTSKRAAQNRAAQRAFRQRKEGYIKKLEEQVRDFGIMEEQFKAIQAENYSLRAYIISLQSRLIESQGEDAVPPPPSHLSGAQRVQTLSTSRISEQGLNSDASNLSTGSAVIRNSLNSAIESESNHTPIPETHKQNVHHDDEEYNAFLAKRLKTDNEPSKTTPVS